ncbi:MAG: hypothetical protein LHV69_08540 [Elusimicrobia bacterium]|nr:hypothetical protein [Candidatus Obscuribacterium magneticum]
MRRKRHCPYCHTLFRPCPRSFRSSTGKYIQKVCSDPACQRKRRLQDLKDYWRRNPLVGSPWRDYHKQQQAWRKKRGRAYMRHYRLAHPRYLKQNRRLQRVRNRKRRMIVKQDSIEAKSVDTLRQIQRLPMLVKQDPIPEIQARQIDGLCRYLLWTRRLVKQDSIALQERIAHNRGHGTAP